MKPLGRKLQLIQLRLVLVAYLREKTIAEDWHAVCDAAMDLREIDAELKGLAES